ncbi:DUF6545 domain-containing protein [Streptomyces sp. NPDC012473]|uniref:DUF6545 domain-containing protein n=1 Tax=Streptomyces sp. NPDC012473 TaxID=3156676 RepID=UPI0033F02255
METFVTPVNLVIAALTIGLGIAKAAAVRQQRDWALRLTASVLVLAGLIFLMATPLVYRAVGNAVGSPNLCALLVPVSTLLCVGHAHILSQLWQEDRRSPEVLRRTAARWAPLYAGAITVMTALYAHAPLGPAAPLKFAAVYSHVPEVVALHFVYWAALITTVVVTVRECSRLSVPGRPGFRRALGWFAVALGMDLVNVGLTATALLGSTAGTEQLAGVAESAWVSTIAGCIAANIALASMVLRSRRAEREDRRTLQALHDLVVGRDPAVEQDPHIVLAPRWSLWTRFDTSLQLNSLMAETHDGCGRLSPWWSPLPAAAVARLAVAPGQQDLDEHMPAGWNLAAAQEAAILLYAAQARDAGRPALPVGTQLVALPGADVEPHADREHLVQVARHLDHPVVVEAAELARQVLAASTS